MTAKVEFKNTEKSKTLRVYIPNTLLPVLSPVFSLAFIHISFIFR